MKSITKIRIKLAATSLACVIMFFVAVGGLGAILIKGCSEINDRGLKNVIEEVWEGRQQGQGETE